MQLDEKQIADLLWALRTRVLTPDEMDTVRQCGYWMCAPRNAAFYEADIRNEYNNLLMNQLEMRLRAERANA